MFFGLDLAVKIKTQAKGKKTSVVLDCQGIILSQFCLQSSAEESLL